MKPSSLVPFIKKNPAFAIFLRRMVNNKGNSTFACYLFELLNKYSMANDQIVSDNCKIFCDNKIRKALEEFIASHPPDLIPLKYIRINKYIPLSSCLKHFNTINQDFSNNFSSISIFQNKFNIEVEVGIRFKAFNLKKAMTLCDSLIKNDIDLIDFIFDFPPLNKDSAFSLISNIERFCISPVLKNTKIRLVNFPFCFIPDAQYKCLYRHTTSTLKGQVYPQKITIRELKKKEFTYFKPCKMCRCKIPCYDYTVIQQFPEYSPFLFPKTQSTLVFVGGSLREAEYCGDKDIVYTDPAEQGDMIMTILEGFKNIIIIDGYFYDKFPCTTFEVMLALENGINVFGSSSIGALRAVELDNYGMTGIGYVYEYLKKQYIKPYHIVAQTYNVYNIPLTIPLVDIIYFLECALSEGVIIKNELDKCLSVADDIYFTALSFKYFLKQLKSEKRVSVDVILRLEDYLSYKGEQFFNIKKKDALLLLNEFRNILKNREQDYIKKVFNQAKEKYLKALYSKYPCNYDLTLPKGWKLSSPKQKPSTSCNTRDNREYLSEDTCELAKIFFEDMDIVIADTTKYDSANSFIITIFFIPFYFLKYNLSCSSGNGNIFNEALASAYMELIERISFCGFNINALKYDEIDRKPFPYKELPQYYNWYVSPRSKAKRVKTWGYVEATDILSGKNIFIPRFITTCLMSGTDGNASGNSLPEAVLYGIYELIERDITTLCKYGPISYESQSKLLINKKDIKDKRCQTLLEQFEAKGCKIVLKNLVNIYNIPCIGCSVYDLDNRIMLHGGAAVRSNFYPAVYAALNEAYMQYITYFIGTRDDYESLFKKHMQHIAYKKAQQKFFISQNSIKIPLSTVKFNSMRDELDYVIGKLINAGVDRVIIVNNSPSNKFKLKSVKVIIPKLEIMFVIPFKPSPFFSEKIDRTIRIIRHLTEKAG